MTEYPLNSQSFECRPRHGSLPLVLLPASWIPGLVDCIGTATGLDWLAKKVLCDCGAVCAICSAGIVTGGFERLSEEPPRERLLERPRMRDVMASKKDVSVGDDTGCDVDAGEVGGDVWPDDCVCCESAVFVLIGGGMN